MISELRAIRRGDSIAREAVLPVGWAASVLDIEEHSGIVFVLLCEISNYSTMILLPAELLLFLSSDFFYSYFLLLSSLYQCRHWQCMHSLTQRLRRWS
jgi:hypothetical protein